MNHFLATALVCCLAGSVRAEVGPVVIQPGLPVRELTVQSKTVVVAAPGDPAAPERFRAVRVVLGSGVKEGDVFDIDGLSSYELTVPRAEGATDRKLVHVAQVLLFLGPPNSDPANPRPPLIPSGMRIQATDGIVYYLKHERFDKKYFLAPYHATIRWDELVKKVAADATEVRRLRSLQAIADPHRRNEALLDWVERRRAEFGGGLEMDAGEEPSYGWGSLEQDVFLWIFESRIPDDCWEAVKLYAGLNQGWNPWLQTPAFGTRAGRRLLLSIVKDDDLLSGHRARALELLALPLTLWPVTRREQPAAVEPLDEKEQTDLIDAVTPLLKGADPRVRTAAARALLEFSSPKADSLRSFRTQRALSALITAYQGEPPGWTRDALAESVAVIAGPQRWQELTGNAYGVVAVLNPRSRQGAEADCTVAAPQAKAKIQDQPKLLLERLDEKQKAVEKKEQPLKLDPNHWAWPTERGADYCVHFEFSMADFTPGVWRITVKGVAGPDKAPWTSEPRLLRLAPPPQPNQPNPDPTAPRIIFDP